MGLSEGNIFQGELALQQMFFLRPVPAWAQYATPIVALYQCGSGTHPGGGVMGASGRNAAHDDPEGARVTLAVVIGDGIDELVAAHYLAKAGHDVTLVSAGVHGLHNDTEPGWVPPGVVRDLGLEQHGFAVVRGESWVRVPLGGADSLDLVSDVGRCAQAIRRLSIRDAERWPDFCVRMHALANVLAYVYCAPPPDPLTNNLGEMIAGARTALRVRGLGRQGMADLLRLLPMSIADLLERVVRERHAEGCARRRRCREPVPGHAVERHRVQLPASARGQCARCVPAAALQRAPCNAVASRHSSTGE